MKSLSRTRYNELVAIVVMILLIVMLVYFVKKLLETRQHTYLKIFFLYLTIVLIWLHAKVCFVMNVEIIHSFQYGILAILIFPLVGRLGDAVYWSTLLGAFDEWFQYRVLYPDKNDYYDLNDIVLNTLGACFAVALLFNSGLKDKIPPQYGWKRSPVIISAGMISMVTGLLFYFDKVRLYAGGQETPLWFLFNTAEAPGDFWRSLKASDITFHVITPEEGLVILCLLIGFGYLLDVINSFSRVKTSVPVA